MIDPFGRHVTYLRLSVTDRCDLRCTYCMAEDMTFLPRQDLLSLEELERLSQAFVRLGVRKIRLTGGEPLVRRNVMSLVRALGKLEDLDELTLTTNGTQLSKYAGDLADAGIRRINVSLDSLNPDTFRQLTRHGDLNVVLDGIEAARDAGLKIKINAVALKNINEGEIDRLLEWCGERGFDFCLIETMPMGEVEHRLDHYLPLSQVRQRLEANWTLVDNEYSTGGPARYATIAETGCKIGFITPMTHNFCENCNRVRLTCTGTLYMCLGQNDDADLRSPLRQGATDSDLDAAILAAIGRKPKGHDFIMDDGAPSVARHMSVTGG